MATPDYVSRDRELEAAHAETVEHLAEHRWHWTLDETNEGRVPFREYARQVGRQFSAIHAHAHGFAAWRDRDVVIRPGGPETLTDYIEQAKLGADKAEATQAVAAVTGRSFASTATRQRAEVREVLTTAQDRAERKGTTVSEEIPAVAEWRQRGRQARQRERDERLARDFRVVEFEGHVGAAIRRLREALSMAKDIDFTDEEVELVKGSLESLRTVVRLIDSRVMGTTGVDWDAEFREVMNG